MKGLAPGIVLACISLALMQPVAASGRQAAKGPSNPQANVQRAVAYEFRAYGKLRTGDLDGAIADYDRAIQLNRLIQNLPWPTVTVELPSYRRATSTEQPSRNPTAPVAVSTPSPIIIATPSNPTPIPTAIPRVGSNDAQYYDDRGFRYYQQKNYEKAVNDYDEAIRLDPNFTNAYRNRGNAFKAQGENEKADADFGKAAQVGSSH